MVRVTPQTSTALSNLSTDSGFHRHRENEDKKLSQRDYNCYVIFTGTRKIKEFDVQVSSIRRCQEFVRGDSYPLRSLVEKAIRQAMHKGLF
jgi:hypothetical protein